MLRELGFSLSLNFVLLFLSPLLKLAHNFMEMLVKLDDSEKFDQSNDSNDCGCSGSFSHVFSFDSKFIYVNSVLTFEIFRSRYRLE